MLSKWSFLQLVVLAIMVLAFFVLSHFNNFFQDLLQSEMALISGSFLSTVMLVTFFIGCFYLLAFFQEKKHGTFLSHSNWDRMIVVFVTGIFLSTVVMVSVFTSVGGNIGAEARWVIDGLLVYFLLLVYGLVLSVLVRFRETATNETIIHRSFFAAIVALIIFVFMF